MLQFGHECETFCKESTQQGMQAQGHNLKDDKVDDHYEIFVPKIRQLPDEAKHTSNNPSHGSSFRLRFSLNILIATSAENIHLGFKE